MIMKLKAEARAKGAVEPVKKKVIGKSPATNFTKI
jgi:hypothetical protein